MQRDRPKRKPYFVSRLYIRIFGLDHKRCSRLPIKPAKLHKIAAHVSDRVNILIRTDCYGWIFSYLKAVADVRQIHARVRESLDKNGGPVASSKSECSRNCKIGPSRFQCE